jgi:hypothetical protein
MPERVAGAPHRAIAAINGLENLKSVRGLWTF